jgi:hypothetical protein
MKIIATINVMIERADGEIEGFSCEIPQHYGDNPKFVVDEASGLVSDVKNRVLTAIEAVYPRQT